MDWNTRRINKAVRNFERYLYASKDCNGLITINRESRRFESYDWNGITLVYSRPSPQYIFACTDTTTLTGRPVDMGVEYILNKLTEIDMQNRGIDAVAQHEKSIESKAKDLDNTCIGMADEMYYGFKHAFKDINTSLMKGY